jgi:hypothetical protein
MRRALFGLLCFRCNNALADFQEDTALLGRAIDYLVSFSAQDEIQLARERARALGQPAWTDRTASTAAS